MSPDKFCFNGDEEGFDGSVIVTITFAAHCGFEVMLPQSLLIIVRTILAVPLRSHDLAQTMRVAIRVMNAALGWLPERNGHLLRSDRKIPLHTIADRPADHPLRMQVILLSEANIRF